MVVQVQFAIFTNSFNDLKAELAMAQAELCIMQCQQQQQNAKTSFFLDTNLISDYC